MSYPAIKSIMQERGINPETASEAELRECLWEAFRQNLPQGIERLKAFADEVRASGLRLMLHEDPNSTLGRQLGRLVGTDVARSVCAENLGIAFGFYNCCEVVGALQVAQLNLTALEQIRLQDGTLASADC